MTPIYSLSVAFVCCVAAVPVAITLSKRWQLFDAPGALKLHHRPISRLGGVAVWLAFSIGVVVSDTSTTVMFLLAALALLAFTGLVDDLLGLSPATRLVAQTTAAAILWSGVNLRVPAPGRDGLRWIVAILFVVLVVNAFNLLDGADGVAAGVAAIVASGYLWLGGKDAGTVTVTASALLGACLGFLLFNFPTAKIFLGDAGSTSIGLVIAFIGLEKYAYQPSTTAGFLAPLVFVGLPLLDMAMAVVRRVQAGASPWLGDRRHFYDLLLQKGWSPRGVALSCYAVAFAFVLAGIESNHNFFNGLAPSFLVSAVFVSMAVHLGSLKTAP